MHAAELLLFLCVDAVLDQVRGLALGSKKRCHLSVLYPVCCDEYVCMLSHSFPCSFRPHRAPSPNLPHHSVSAIPVSQGYKHSLCPFLPPPVSPFKLSAAEMLHLSSFSLAPKTGNDGEYSQEVTSLRCDLVMLMIQNCKKKKKKEKSSSKYFYT